MKAIRFKASVPRYAVGMTLGKLSPPMLWSGLSCTFAAEVPEPALPTASWLRIKTRYGGICGSDTGTVFLHASPYYTPLVSPTFTLGHENVGTIAQVGPQSQGDWQAGERVTAAPLLWCAPRGFGEYCRFCARGEINRCERMTEGDLSPGQMIGLCYETGGSWSSSFVAHPSQVYRIPEGVSDENALMVEPFAIGLHAALLEWPSDGDTALIVGAGTIGLTVLAALRALGSKARLLITARYPFQAEAARRLGADEVLLSQKQDPYAWVADKTGGALHKPIIGKRVLAGGADITFECVGSDSTIDDAMRFTRTGGKMVLVGVPGIPKGVDWTALFDQELTVKGSNYYNNTEPWQGKTWRAFDLAFHLMEAGLDLGWMVTHRYALADYRRALNATRRRGANGMIKGVFEF